MFTAFCVLVRQNDGGQNDGRNGIHRGGATHDLMLIGLQFLFPSIFT